MRKTIVEKLFSGDYFDQKHIRDFIGFFGADYGNSGC